jgi:hypothetical protein
MRLHLIEFTKLIKEKLMGTIVYSTSPFQAFLWTFVGLGVLVLLGLFVGVSTFFDRKAKVFSRIATIAASVIMLAIGCVGLGFTYISMNGNAVKVSLLLDKKQVVQESCGNEGDTCEHNQLSMHDSTGKDYEFRVPQKAYDATEENQCYAVTYYPNKGLKNMNGTDSGYIYSEYVTEIASLDRSACP